MHRLQFGDRAEEDLILHQLVEGTCPDDEQAGSFERDDIAQAWVPGGHAGLPEPVAGLDDGENRFLAIFAKRAGLEPSAVEAEKSVGRIAAALHVLAGMQRDRLAQAHERLLHCKRQSTEPQVCPHCFGRIGHERHVSR
jgi:hypothetical protein